MPEKQFKQVCECENCGNEAEMLITCHIEYEDENPPSKPAPEETKKIKGQGVCTTCGNEADMWVDF